MQASGKMTDPLLPPGIKVSAGLGLDDMPVVRIELRLIAGDNLALVLPLHQAWQMAMPLLDQEDRRLRTLGALVLRQVSLARAGRSHGLYVVGGSEA